MTYGEAWNAREKGVIIGNDAVAGCLLPVKKGMDINNDYITQVRLPQQMPDAWNNPYWLIISKGGSK
jgi:hypothetical protein